MVAERIYIVDAEFFDDECSEVFQVHAWDMRIAVGIGGAFDKSAKGPGSDGEAIMRCGREGQMRLGLRSLRPREKISRGEAEAKLLQNVTTREMWGQHQVAS